MNTVTCQTCGYTTDLEETSDTLPATATCPSCLGYLAVAGTDGPWIEPCDVADVAHLVARTLGNRDMDQDWQDAGYRTSLDAAIALVGYGTPRITRAAAHLVACQLDAEQVSR